MKLSAFGLDRRLSGLARAMHANDARYADDLIFSGDRDFAGKIGGFLSAARRSAKLRVLFDQIGCAPVRS